MKFILTSICVQVLLMFINKIIMYFPKINLKLLPIKLHFLLYNAGIAPFVPYLSTYARQLGFNSVTIGIIYTIIPIFGMASKPLLGIISDKYKCHKYIFIGVILLTGLSAIGFYFIPALSVENTVNVICKNQEYFTEIPKEGSCIENQLKTSGDIFCQMTCPTFLWNTKNVTLQYESTTGSLLHFAVFADASNATQCNNTTCNISCNLHIFNELSEKSTLNNTVAVEFYQFWLLLFLMILCWIGQAVTISLGDTICFELLGQQSHKYGEQRLYGSLGWGILCVITGYIIDSSSSESSTKNYAIAFYIAFIILLINTLVCLKIQLNPTETPKNILKGIIPLLRNFRVVVYLLWVVCVGLCTGLVWQFLFWLLEDLAAAKGCDTFAWIKTLEGATIAVQSFSEILILFFSGWIIKKLSHEYSMSLVLFAIGCKFVLYSVINDPRWILLVELSNGLTIGLFYSCMASYANIVSTSGTKATVQGLVGAALDGFGVAVGSFVGGYLYKFYGGSLTFRIFGVGALIACILHFAVHLFIAKREMTNVDNVEPNKKGESLY